MNVIEERIPYNVHFKKPFAPTYMEQLNQMETDGLVSLRGLRKGTTLFNKIVIDVNTISREFKVKIALEALREESTIQQLSVKYSVHPKV